LLVVHFCFLKYIGEWKTGGDKRERERKRERYGEKREG
jgi:hypothetical protein